MLSALGLLTVAVFLIVGSKGQSHALFHSTKGSQTRTSQPQTGAPERTERRASSTTKQGATAATTATKQGHSPEPSTSPTRRQSKSAKANKTSERSQTKRSLQSQALSASSDPRPSATSQLKARLIQEANRFAKQSEDPWRNLITIALQEQQSGNRSSALRLLETADRLATNPNDPQAQARGKREVIAAMLSLHLEDEATSLATALPTGTHRDGALSDLSIWLAKDGQIPLSKTIAQSIKNPKSRHRALTSVSESEVNTNGVNFAIATANEIPDERYRDDALRKTAVRAATLDNYLGAELAANTIENDRRKDSAFSTIISLRAKSGAIEPSMELLNRIVDSRVADETKRQLAIQLANQRRFSTASLVISHINNQKEQDFARQRLSTSKALAGRVPEALSELNHIQNLTYKERALSYIATSVAKTKQIYQARNIANLIETPRMRDQTYRHMADIAASHDDLTTAYNLTQDIDAYSEKASALAQLSRRRLKLGDNFMANRYLTDAENAFRQIQNTAAKDRALTSLSTVYAEKGASHTALEYVYQIESNRQRDRAYRNLSSILAKQQEISLATISAEAIENEKDRFRALDDVARTYGKVIAPHKAIRMARSFDSYRQKVVFLLEVAKRV